MSFKQRILIAVILLLILLIIGTIAYKIIGGAQTSIIDAAYMAAITLSTVGYDEVIDVSYPAARIFTVVFIILAVVTLAFVTSSFAAFILEVQLKGIWRRRKMNKQIANLSGHYIICGAGQTGIHIIQELSSTLQPFVVVDLNEERLNKLASTNKSFLFIKGDATEDEVLLEAGVERARGIIAALPSDKDNLYIIVMAKQYNPAIRIVALGVEDKAISKLQKAGADAVISSSLIGGLRMASEMIRPSVVKFLDGMLLTTKGTIRIEEIHIKPGSKVANKSLAELPFRDQFGLLILAIKPPQTDEPVFGPHIETRLSEDSILFVMGEINNIRKAQEYTKE